VRLIYNKDDGTLTSETYNRTGKSLMSYGPYEAWVEINVTGLHYEYNMSTRSWDWVNGTFRQMNLTTVEGWHWSYYALNQTAYALDPSDQGAWINRDKVCLSQDDPAFKVTPSYADLIDASTGIEEGNIVSNLTIAFNMAAPQTRYWWELVYGNLTFGADYSQGW
jgi:hypothetical protein